jgi:hypothetical protein
MVSTCNAEADQVADSAPADAVAQIRQGCEKLRLCANQCVAYDGQVDSSCVAHCVLPNSSGRGGSSTTNAKDTPPSAAKHNEKDKRGLCIQAGEFRDHQLFHLWDTQQKKYTVFTEGSKQMALIRSKTTDLLDDDWWAGSTAAAVAIEIRGFSDMVNDTLSLFIPEGQLLAGSIHHAAEIAKGVTVVGDLVTYTKENAEAAAKQNAGEVFAQYGGQIGATTKLLIDAAAYARTKKDQEDYREEVQMQVRRINQNLRDLESKRKQAVERMDAYQEIVRGIDMICANEAQKGLSVNGPN